MSPLHHQGDPRLARGPRPESAPTEPGTNGSTWRDGRLDGRVVVGFDGSPKAYLALDWAAQWSDARGLPLTVLSATRPPTVALPTNAVLDQVTFRRLRSRWGQRLDEAVRLTLARHPRIEVDAALMDADPVSALIEAGRSASLVVTGTRGLGMLRGLMAGAVADRVLSRAAGPIAILPSAPRRAHGPVVVGIDSGATASAAARFAFAHASAGGQSVLAVWAQSFHGFDPHRAKERARYESLRDAAYAELAEALEAASADHPGVSYDGRVMMGRTAPVLRRASRTASLLVLGTRGRGPWTGLVGGSTSRALAQTASCPTLVVPERPDPLSTFQGSIKPFRIA